MAKKQEVTISKEFAVCGNDYCIGKLYKEPLRGFTTGDRVLLVGSEKGFALYHHTTEVIDVGNRKGIQATWVTLNVIG